LLNRTLLSGYILFDDDGVMENNIEGFVIKSRWNVTSKNRGSLTYSDGSRGSFSILDGCKIRWQGTVYK